MNDIYPLTVRLSEYALSPELIDSLAVEFYGLPVAASGTPKTDELTIEFRDMDHPVLETHIGGLDCMTSFLNALDSYRLPNPHV